MIHIWQFTLNYNPQKKLQSVTMDMRVHCGWLQCGHTCVHVWIVQQISYRRSYFHATHMYIVHVGYWHGSDVSPLGPWPSSSMSLHSITYMWNSSLCNNYYLGEERVVMLLFVRALQQISVVFKISVCTYLDICPCCWTMFFWRVLDICQISNSSSNFLSI